ncbi:MAG: SDR family NAD(P)-dependent oxidoreductase [Rhodospirillales bacterium]|nr:SDR family NAD(P)-dependent oxidoreductase [Rhodospirillales bacterium]
MTQNETALIVGAGPGLGSALARCLADDGMNVAVASRDPSRHNALISDIESSGAAARAFACDTTNEDQVRKLFADVARDLGDPNLVVFNAGAFVREEIVKTTAEDFERCWRIGCLGGFLVGREAAGIMLAGGGGTILFTGATASLRGGAMFHNLAVPKFGLRALSQSMARELGPQGIHVAHVVIDGQILSDHSAELARERPEDGLLAPEAIALNFLHLHQQHRSAWSQELDLRPWVEKF